jgi:CMP-N-acetylneuraminic acid synthetase
MSAAHDRVVALMPIKRNSERVPGKNFRDFNGRPLFRWMLDTLLEIEELDRIVINTDARDLLEWHGAVDSAKVLLRDRRPEIRGDHVSMNRVLADDISEVQASRYLMTHATNPLLSAASIRRALAAFEDALRAGRADSLFTVNRHQSRFYRADGSPINHDPQNLIPTQQLEPWFEENSTLYLFTPESFAATAARIGQRPEMFTLPPSESLDIDDMDGWNLAEAVARGRDRS